MSLSLKVIGITHLVISLVCFSCLMLDKKMSPEYYSDAGLDSVNAVVINFFISAIPLLNLGFTYLYVQSWIDDAKDKKDAKGI